LKGKTYSTGIKVKVRRFYGEKVRGPDDPHFGESCQIARNVLKGVWKISVKGSLPISDVRDIVKLHLSLMEKGKGPRRYFTPVVNVTLKELMSTFSNVTGKKRGTIPLPEWTLLLPMKGLDTFQKILPIRLPFNFQAVYSVSCNHQMDDSSTRKDFSIQPRSLDETLKDQIQWMVQEEYITPSLAGSRVTG
jgi:dihydroflavonol-4-reductase